MVKRWIAVVVLLVICVCAPAARAAVAPSDVEAALRKAVDFLYKQQKDGHWELVPAPDKSKNVQDPSNGQFTGRTALVLLALLNSGEKPNDPRIQSAVNFVMKNQTQGVYALGLRCQLWLALPKTRETEAAMRNDARILATSFKKDGNGRGMYDYNPTGRGFTPYSHSRAQYAVLGMWAAAQMGLEVPDAYWKLTEDAWKRNQAKDGGWTYMHPNETNHPTTPGMTTVGVASLFITHEYLRAHEGVLCRGNQTNPAIEKGLAWLTKNIDAFPNKRPNSWGGRAFVYPTLYAYERVGAASGLRYFGNVDWYEVGADWTLKAQKPDGSWTTSNPTPHLNSVTDTCFAMLFLAKGRAPIVMSKLQYADPSGKEGRWNQRSRDVANVTRWIGNLLERELAFQIVNLDVAIEDLAETPLLVISGNEAVNLSDKHKAKLKAYIEAGGTVVANADCSAPAFSQSIKKLGAELFPDYEFSSLPEDDVIFTEYYPRSKWKTKPPVEVLSNGVRKLILLLPAADPGKSWQIQDARLRPEHFELMADILLYAVDRQGLRYRGERYYLPDDRQAKPSQTVTVARLKYPANWDPEPGGWRQFNNFMIKRLSTAVKTKTVELGKGELKDVKIAHLTGTVGAKLSEAAREEIRKFVQGGGTLIIDVAGGASAFATMAEEELRTIFPDGKLEQLPAEHALYKAGGGTDPEYTYRSYTRKVLGRLSGPRLQGMTVNGRLAVIYSREDLSAGLVGQQVDGIVGYTPESASNLMARIIAHAADLKAPAAKPAEKKDDKKPEKKDAKK